MISGNYVTKAFVAAMMIGTLWSIANGLEISALTLEHKLVWANIQYIAYSLAPVTWIIMVLQFTEKAHWVNKKNLLFALIIPVLTICFVWMDPAFGIVRYGIYLDTTGSLPVISKKYSPWFWVHFAQAYFLNFYSLFLLLKSVFIKKTTIYRTQSFLLLIGTGLIAVVNLAYISGIRFFHYDISPITFSISGAIIAWGIFRFQLFRLIPIARNKVIEAMKNIVIVLDAKGIVVDVNPAAAESFAINQEQEIIGRSLRMLSREIADLVNQKDLLLQREFQFDHSNGSICRCYEFQISQILNHKGSLMGRVIVMNDISELKQAQEELNREQRELAVMGERDRMAKDLHDNLGQIFSFAGIQLQVAQMERNKGNHEIADNYLNRLREIIDEGHKEIRNYVYNTRMEEYRNNSMENLVLNQVYIFILNSGYFSRDDITLNLVTSDFSVEVQMHIINIVKEALNNILKHACATFVKISLVAESGYYRLMIKDNGIGFAWDGHIRHNQGR